MLLRSKTPEIKTERGRVLWANTNLKRYKFMRDRKNLILQPMQEPCRFMPRHSMSLRTARGRRDVSGLPKTETFIHGWWIRLLLFLRNALHRWRVARQRLRPLPARSFGGNRACTVRDKKQQRLYRAPEKPSQNVSALRRKESILSPAAVRRTIRQFFQPPPACKPCKTARLWLCWLHEEKKWLSPDFPCGSLVV